MESDNNDHKRVAPDDDLAAKKQRIHESLKSVKIPKTSARKKTGIINKFKKQDKPKPKALVNETILLTEPVVEKRAPPPTTSNPKADAPPTQKIALTGVGSRADVSAIREEHNALTNRIIKIFNAVRKIDHPDSKKLGTPMTNTTLSMKELNGKIDAAFLAVTTLTALEAARYRQIPNSRIPGLAMNPVDADRLVELSRRLSRTPITTTEAEIDVADFKKALAGEIDGLLDRASDSVLLSSGQRAISQLCQKLITKAPLPKQKELCEKLKIMMELQSELLTLRSPAALVPLEKRPILDPLAGASIIPPM